MRDRTWPMLLIECVQNGKRLASIGRKDSEYETVVIR